jgi:hypothetical protein
MEKFLTIWYSASVAMLGGLKSSHALLKDHAQQEAATSVVPP